jgi:hypothetical protein
LKTNGGLYRAIFEARQYVDDERVAMARAFVAKLQEILPGRPAGLHAWAYVFCVGALTRSAFDERISNIAAVFDVWRQTMKNRIGGHIMQFNRTDGLDMKY